MVFKDSLQIHFPHHQGFSTSARHHLPAQPALQRTNAASPLRDQRFRLSWERCRKQPELPKASRAWRGRKNGDLAGSLQVISAISANWISGRRAQREDSVAEHSIPKSNYVQ